MAATKLRQKIRRFVADERGNIAIMGATSFLMVIACAALGIDVGSIFADKRRTQSAADLAAIVAASDLNNASRAAAATVAKNKAANTCQRRNPPNITAAPAAQSYPLANLPLASGNRPPGASLPGDLAHRE